MVTIPAALQQRRPVIPKTVAQLRAERQPVPTPAKEIAEVKAKEIVQQVQVVDPTYEKDWYTAMKMAFSGRGEAGVSARANRFYDVITGRIQPGQAGLSLQEQRFALQVREDVKGAYYSRQVQRERMKEISRLPKEQRVFGIGGREVPEFEAPEVEVEEPVKRRTEIQKILTGDVPERIEEVEAFKRMSRPSAIQKVFMGDVPKTLTEIEAFKRTQARAKPDPLAISLPTDEPYETRPLISGVLEAVRRTPEGVARIIKGERGLRYIGEGFRGTGKFRGEEVISPQMAEVLERKIGKFPSATIMDKDFVSSYEGMTFNEVRERLEIEAGLTPNLPEEVRYSALAEEIANQISLEINREIQLMINKKEISFEEGEVLAEELFQKRFEKRYSTESKKLQTKLKSIYLPLDETYGTTIAKAFPQVAETGLLVGAYLTGPVGATLASGYLVGSAIGDISTGILGEDLTTGERASSFLTGGLKAGFGMWGISSVIGKTPTSMLARQSRKLAQQELEAQKFSFGGREIMRGERGSIFKTTYTRATPLASQEIEILSPVFQAGEKGVRAVGVKAVTKTRIGDVISGYVAKDVSRFTLGARVTLQKGARIRFKDISYDLPEDYLAYTGTGFIKRKGAETFKQFKVGGLVKEEEGFYQIIGAEPKYLLLGEKVAKAKAKITGVGRIEKFGVSDDALEMISGGVKKTPLSTTFQVQKVQPVFQKEFIKQVVKVTPKVTPKAVSFVKEVGKVTGLLSSQRLEQKAEQMPITVTRDKQELKVISKAKVKAKVIPSLLSSSALVLEPITKTEAKARVSLLSLSLSGLAERMEERTAQRYGLVPSVSFTPKVTPPTPKPKVKLKIPFGFLFPGEKPEVRKEQAYYGYARIDATKKRKARWKRVTPQSTKQGAVDLTSEFVDKNISAKFKVSKVKKEIKGKEKFVQVERDKLQQGTGYWNVNKYKFRRFKQKKGVRTRLPGGAIEKQPYRLDSPGEVRKIHRARASAGTLLFGGFGNNKNKKRGFRL